MRNLGLSGRVVSLIILLFGAGSSYAQTVSKTFCRDHAPGLAIPDDNASGVNSDLNIPVNATILDLKVSLKVTHTWVGDLVAKLTNETIPAGPATLIDRPGLGVLGCSKNDLNLIFDDVGTGGLYEDAACVGNSTVTLASVSPPNYNIVGFPGVSLGSTFPFSNTAGTWRLNISDNSASDIGTLTQWCLIVTLDDGDEDGLPEGFDNCTSVPNVDQADTDGDGVGNVCDNCFLVANPSQEDADRDGTGNLCDLCSGDQTKSAPGTCGCGFPDVDLDGNGTVDCSVDAATSMLSARGILLIPDSSNRRVMAFDPFTGNLLNPNFIPEDSVNQSAPVQALLSKDGTKILVADSTKDYVFAYNLNGSALGIFAPSTGVDNNILNSPRSMTYLPNGKLAVASASGVVNNTVATFDGSNGSGGTIFIPNTSGISSAQGMTVFGTDLLVSSTGNNQILKFDVTSGAATGVFAAVNESPQQLLPGLNSTFFLANASSSNDTEGLVELNTSGTVVGNTAKLPYFSTPRSIWQLQNGSFLVSGSSGVRIVSRTGEILSTKIASTTMRFISFALKDQDGDALGDGIDGCVSDPSKTTPGACGCGVTENDVNANGIFDCLIGAELKSRLSNIQTLIKQLKLKDGKFTKASKQIKKALQDANKELTLYVNTQGALIVLSDSSKNLNKLIVNISKTLKTLLKGRSESFSKDKKNTNKALNALIGVS